MRCLSKKTEDTLKLGEKIGKRLKLGMLLALEGDLGGGKTTFTKGVAKGLGVKEEITSPTFTLMKIYQTPRTSNHKLRTILYHFDFYRIDSPEDMVGYELQEALEDSNGIVIVEWAEKIEASLPKEKLVVKFRYVDDNSREIIFEPTGEKYEKLLK